MAAILTKPAAYVVDFDPTTGDTISNAVSKNQGAIDYLFANIVDADTSTKGAVELATDAETTTGTDTTRATTPKGVAAAIAAALGGSTGFGSPTASTISSDAIAVTGTKPWRYHQVDTEALAATDQLQTISGGNAGEVILIMSTNGARVPTLVPGTSLKMPANFSLDSVYDSVALICISSGVWAELHRSNVA